MKLENVEIASRLRKQLADWQKVRIDIEAYGVMVSRRHANRGGTTGFSLDEGFHKMLNQMAIARIDAKCMGIRRELAKLGVDLTNE